MFHCKRSEAGGVQIQRHLVHAKSVQPAARARQAPQSAQVEQVPLVSLLPALLGQWFVEPVVPLAAQPAAVGSQLP